MPAMLMPILALALAALSPDDVREAAHDVLDDPAYQSELPSGARAPEPPQLELRRPSRTASDISAAVLWVLVAVAIGILGLWIASLFWGHERDVELREAGASSQPEAGQRAGPSLLDEPEALAREGRYDEAIHALLLRALAALRATRPTGLPDSLTSREVLREVSLGTAAFTALRSLIEAVELSLFGGRPAARDDYVRCTESFRAFRADVPSRRGAVA